jgi:hypothetical protein
MGVRFPNQQERPDFGLIQQANNAQQPPTQQEETQPLGQVAPGQVQEPAEEDTILEAQEPQALSRQTPAERAADDAGAQTPGSIIDMLA